MNNLSKRLLYSAEFLIVFYCVVAFAQTDHSSTTISVTPSINPTSTNIDDPSSHTNSEQPVENTAQKNAQKLKGQELLESSLADTMLANTLVFWSTARGQRPSTKLLNEAQIDSGAYARFNENLKRSQKLSPKLIRALRKDFSPKLLSQRNRARQRFLSFSEQYQKSFPSFGEWLPEILLAWGEARNLSGLADTDILQQQAKMASVLHVLKNRVNRFCQNSKNTLCKGKNNAYVKWILATKRFQFSAFEPYDPNLAELALGPKTSKKITGLESLPDLDRRALKNLVATLIKMQNKEITLPNPLGDTGTRHYLSPPLISYTPENAKTLETQIKSDDRKRVVHIPKSNPQYLAIVPNWAEQDALIADPRAKIQSPHTSDFSTIQILPKDFIYFRGLL